MDKLLGTLSTLSAGVVVPAFILGFLLLMFAYVLWLAQHRPDFDAANFLRDANGKEDIVKICILIALAITSWVLATLVFNGKITKDYYLYYIVTWANTPGLLLLANKWNGVLPFTKTPEPSVK